MTAKSSKKILAILTSGYDESTAFAGGQPERPQVFLHKPFRMVELQDAIARAMGMTGAGCY